MKTKKDQNENNLKKLSLNKQTLVLLNDNQLNVLRGGNNASDTGVDPRTDGPVTTM